MTTFPARRALSPCKSDRAELVRSPRASQQLGEEIGRGSSGKVYRALNRETGDFRAIKEIPTRNMQTGHLEAVQSEIDLLHNLQHDQIVRYFETIRTEGRACQPAARRTRPSRPPALCWPCA